MSKITSLFTGGESAPSFPAVEPVPTREDPAVKEAERLKREEEVRRRKGSLSTVLTSGMGVTDTANIDTPQLRPTLG